MAGCGQVHVHVFAYRKKIIINIIMILDLHDPVSIQMM